MIRPVFLALVSGLLSVQLCIVGLMQILGAEPVRTNLAELGYPPWFRVLVGVVQLVGVAGLWSPRFRLGAALGLGLVLLGAVASHLRAGHDAEHTAPAVVTLVLLAALAWGRRPAAARTSPRPG